MADQEHPLNRKPHSATHSSFMLSHWFWEGDGFRWILKLRAQSAGISNIRAFQSQEYTRMKRVSTCGFLASGWLRRVGMCFGLFFWMRSMRSSTSPHPPWAAANCLTLLIFSLHLCLLSIWKEDCVSLLRWIAPRGTWEKTVCVYTSKLPWDSSWGDLEQTPCL